VQSEHSKANHFLSTLGEAVGSVAAAAVTSKSMAPATFSVFGFNDWLSFL
jgi:hypothetical protein